MKKKLIDHRVGFLFLSVVLFLASVITLLYTGPFDLRIRYRLMVLSVGLVGIFLALTTSVVIPHLPGSTAKRLPATLENSAVAIGGLLVVLFCLEGVFTFVPRSHGNGQALASIRWMQQYFWNVQDRQGYRQAPRTPEEQKLKKIVVVGDSFVAGHGIDEVEDRFTEVLETKTREKGFIVLNMGNNGSDTINEAYRLHEYRFEPDVLVFSYFANDIDGSAAAHGIKYQFNDPMDELGPLKRLTERSFFFNFVYWLSPKNLAMGYVDYLKRAFKDQPTLDHHKGVLNYFIRYAEKRNIPLVTIVFPFLLDPNPDHSFYLPIVSSYFKSKNIPVIDVSPLIVDIEPKNRVVNLNDPHPSVLVHRIVADALYKKLDEIGILNPQSKVATY